MRLATYLFHEFPKIENVKFLEPKVQKDVIGDWSLHPVLKSGLYFRIKFLKSIKDTAVSK